MAIYFFGGGQHTLGGVQVIFQKFFWVALHNVGPTFINAYTYCFMVAFNHLGECFIYNGQEVTVL